MSTNRGKRPNLPFPLLNRLPAWTRPTARKRFRGRFPPFRGPSAALGGKIQDEIFLHSGGPGGSGRFPRAFLARMSHHKLESATGRSAGLGPALGVRLRKAGYKPALRTKRGEKCGLGDFDDRAGGKCLFLTTAPAPLPPFALPPERQRRGLPQPRPAAWENRAPPAGGLKGGVKPPVQG